MGGGVSLQQMAQLPDVIDADLFQKLVKDKKFAPEAYTIFADYNGMISRRRLEEICVTRDCYMSYDWGIDTKGRSTHRRVLQIADYLTKKKGLVVYTEDGQFRNNTALVNVSLRDRLAKSLSTSSCMLVFLTRRYYDKFVEEKKMKKLPSSMLYTTMQQQSSGLKVPKKRVELEEMKKEEARCLEDVDDNQIQMEFQIFRDLKNGSTRYMIPILMEEKASLDHAPSGLQDVFNHRLVIDASRFEDHIEETLDGLFDYIIKTINPLRLGGPFLQKNQIYGQTLEGKLLNWLRKCLGKQQVVPQKSLFPASSSSKSPQKESSSSNKQAKEAKEAKDVKENISNNKNVFCAEETIEKYQRILLDVNMNSFFKLYGTLQVDEQYLVRLGFQPKHAERIYESVEKEIKENLLMEKIRQIDFVLARQQEKEKHEQDQYHQEIQNVVENAKKMKEMTLMAAEDTLSYTMRAYEQQVVKSVSFEKMQAKFMKQLLEDQIVYQEKIGDIQEMLYKLKDERIFGDRYNRLMQVVSIESVDQICEIFRNVISELERTLMASNPEGGGRGVDYANTSTNRSTTMSSVVSATVSANTSPIMSRKSSVMPTTTTAAAAAIKTDQTVSGVVISPKKELAVKFSSLVRYGVTHQLTATGEFEANVRDVSALSYLLHLSSLILHKIQIMSEDQPEHVNRFVDQGISKLLLTLLAKGYMYQAQFPSLFYVPSGLEEDEKKHIFDPQLPCQLLIFRHHRTLYLPHQILLTITSLVRCQLDKHSLHEQLVYLFGKAGSIDLMMEIIKFHMEHLSIVVLCLQVIDQLLSSSQAQIRQQHIHYFLQNFSFVLLIMILLEKYDLSHLDHTLEEEERDARTIPEHSLPHTQDSLTLQYVALRIYIISIFTKCSVYSQEMTFAQNNNGMFRNMNRSRRASVSSRRNSSTATTGAANQEDEADGEADSTFNYYQDLLQKSRPALISRSINELLVWYVQQHPNILHRPQKRDTAPFLTPTKQREKQDQEEVQKEMMSSQPMLHISDDLMFTLINAVEILYLDRRKIFAPTHHFHHPNESSGGVDDAEDVLALLSAEKMKQRQEAMKKKLQEIDAKIAADLKAQEDERQRKLQAKKDITHVSANHREVLAELAEQEKVEKILAKEQRRAEREAKRKQKSEEAERKKAAQEEEEANRKKKKKAKGRQRSLRETMTILLNEFYLIPFLVHQLRCHRTNSTLVIAIVRTLGNLFVHRNDLRRRANEFSLFGELMLIVKEGLKLFRQHHTNKKIRKNRAKSPNRASSPSPATSPEKNESSQDKDKDAEGQNLHHTTTHSSKLQLRKLGIEILRECFITLSNYFTVINPELVHSGADSEENGPSTSTTVPDAEGFLSAEALSSAGNFTYPHWDCIYYCVDQGLCEIVLEIFSQSQLDDKLLHATLLLLHKMMQCGNFLTCSRLLAIGFVEKMGLFLDMNMSMEPLMFELTCQILISLARSDEIRINASKRLIEKTRIDMWIMNHIRRLCSAKGTNGHWSHYYSHAILAIHPEDTSEVALALSNNVNTNITNNATAAATTLPSFNAGINAMYSMNQSRSSPYGTSNAPDIQVHKKVCNTCILGCSLIHSLCKHTTHGFDFTRKIRIAGFQQLLHKAPQIVGDERDMNTLRNNLDVPMQSSYSVNGSYVRLPLITNPSMQLLPNIVDVPTPEKTRPADSQPVTAGNEETKVNQDAANVGVKKAPELYMLPVDSMINNAHIAFQDRSVEFAQNISKAYFDEMIQEVFQMFRVEYGPLLVPLDSQESGRK